MATTQLVIFLGFVSISVVSNTLILIFAFRAFSGLTSKVTASVSEFSKGGETRQLIDSLQVTAEHAVTLTESAKAGIAEFDPVLRRIQEDYRRTLSNADAKLDKLASDIEVAAETVRDTVAKPAFAVVSFAEGVRKMFSDE
jgi:hypothetical protein